MMKFKHKKINGVLRPIIPIEIYIKIEVSDMKFWWTLAPT